MALDSAALLTGTYCLAEVSKDAEGEVVVLHSDLKTCEGLGCKTLTLLQRLRLRLSQAACDSELGRSLDGQIQVINLATVFTGTSENLRGVHAADFGWSFAG